MNKKETWRILILGQFKNWILEMLKACRGLEHLEVVIRPHHAEPTYDIKEYKKYMKENKIRGEINNKMPLFDQFFDCNLILCVDSSAVLEAIAARRPVVVCAFLKRRFQKISFIEKDVPAPVVNSVEELHEFLKDPFINYTKFIDGLVAK